MADDSLIRYSVLDLAPILRGSTPATSFRNTLDLARHAEKWGYHRYWMAEHHNIRGVASAATAVLIGHVAGGTQRIRVGAGGIMLPNHAPLVIAEQFGTLESLYSGRIDLGLGRAPGGDMATTLALRRHGNSSGDTFPRDLHELQRYFQSAAPDQAVRAIPGEGLDVPIYLLGSSQFSARLAAECGLPFAFASHFAPDYLHIALDGYRIGFQPSEALARPYVMVGMNVFAAETDAEAARLFTSLQQQFLHLIRGKPGELPPPVKSMHGRWSTAEHARVDHMTHYAAVGTADTIREKLETILAETQADEIIVTSQIYDHAARLRSFEIAAEVFEQVNSAAGATSRSSPESNES